MSVPSDTEVLSLVMDYYNLGKKGKVSGAGNCPVLTSSKSQQVAGLMPILSHLSSTNSGSSLMGASLAEASIARQWIQYKSCVLDTAEKKELLSKLSLLNQSLSDSTYLAGLQMTVADIIIYLSIRDVMKNLTFEQKEALLNLSRWFQNVQQDPRLRRETPLVKFSKTKLY